MTIVMPEELQWLSYLAGAEWPEGDEDALFALAEVWHRAADDLRGVVPELHDACDTAVANFSSAGAEQMQAQFEMFFSGDQSVEKMAENLDGLGDMVRNCGAQVEAAKLQIIITLAITAIEIAYALATLFGSAAIPAIEAAAQGIIRTLAQAVLRRLAARAQKYSAMPMWRLVLQQAVQEAAIGIGVDLGVQTYQLAKDHIDDINWKQVAITGAVSGISGAVAAPVASVTAGKLSHWIGGKNGMSPWQAGAVGVGSGIGAGVVGAGAGFVANGAITGDWTFTPAMILGGLGGGLAGGVHGVAGYYSSLGLQPYMPRGGAVPPGSGDGSAALESSRSVEPEQAAEDVPDDPPPGLYSESSGLELSPASSVPDESFDGQSTTGIPRTVSDTPPGSPAFTPPPRTVPGFAANSGRDGDTARNRSTDTPRAAAPPFRSHNPPSVAAPGSRHASGVHDGSSPVPEANSRSGLGPARAAGISALPSSSSPEGSFAAAAPVAGLPSNQSGTPPTSPQPLSPVTEFSAVPGNSAAVERSFTPENPAAPGISTTPENPPAAENTTRPAPFNTPEGLIASDSSTASESTAKLPTETEEPNRFEAPALPHNPADTQESSDRAQQLPPVEAGNPSKSDSPALAQVTSRLGGLTAHGPGHPTAPNGMHAREFEKATGAPLRHFADHETLGNQLLALGDGATALVVDSYRGPGGRYSVGAHTYVLHNRGGELHVRDTATATDSPLDTHSPADTRGPHAILYASDGTPHIPAAQPVAGHSAKRSEGNDPFAGIPQGDTVFGADLHRQLRSENNDPFTRTPEGDTVFGADLQARLNTEIDGRTTVDRNRSPLPEQAQSLPDTELLSNLSAADRLQQMPSLPVPLRVSSTGTAGADRLVLVDSSGATVRLPISGKRPAVLVPGSGGPDHYRITLSRGRDVQVPAALVDDFTYTAPATEGAIGELSWNLPAGRIRILGTDVHNNPHAVSLWPGSVVLATAEGDGSRSIKLPGLEAEPGWVRVNTPDGLLPDSPVRAARHEDPLFGPAGPKPTDVRPGAAGAYRLLAAVKNLATHDRDALTDILHDYGDGTAGVRFFIGGRTEWVRVEKEIHISPGTRTGHFVHHEPGQPLWASMVAKAYAQRFGQGDGYHGIAADPAHIVAARLGHGFHQDRDSGTQQPVADMGDTGFLHPLRFDTDTLYELTGGDPGFARRVAETYEHWRFAVEQHGQPVTPADFRSYLDKEYPGKPENDHWRQEKTKLVRYFQTLNIDAVQRRILPDQYEKIAHWTGNRIDRALRHHATVVLETRELGPHHQDSGPIPGLLSNHSYSVAGIERDANGEPARILLENQYDHNGTYPRPVDGIEYRYDATPRAAYRPARGGGGYRIDTERNRYWWTPDGKQGMQRPDGTRYGMLPDGTRYRKDPDGTRWQVFPDGSRHRQDPGGTEYRTTADGTALRKGHDDTDWVPDPERADDPGDKTVPARGGVIAVDLQHLPKFGRLDVAGPGAHLLYGTPLSDAVQSLGINRDGAQDMNHITELPHETVDWLHEQIFTMVEGDRGPDEKFRAAVRAKLTPRLASGEWARLLSTSGLPLRVEYRGSSYPVALRLSLRGVRPSDQGIAPVGIQRWAFGISDITDSSGSSNFRSFAYSFSKTWDVDAGLLRRIGIKPGVTAVHNQLSSGLAATSTVQPMILMRSKGASKAFDYEMVWELRPGEGLPGLLSSTLPDNGWQRVHTDQPEQRLVVWFPEYLADNSPLPTIYQNDPSTVPAPVERLREEFPIYGPVGFPHHDQVLADVMDSFGQHLGGLSDYSGERLREFFSEGNIRSTIPLAWGGSADSPTLYTASGNTIGFLRLTMDLTGGHELTGPTTKSSVMESHVLRMLRLDGSSVITNSFGGNFALTFGFGGKKPESDTEPEPLGGELSFKAGASQSFSHTLKYGGNMRISHSLRTGEPFLHVTPQLNLKVTLVRPAGPPVGPEPGSALHGGRDYPLNLLVPSLQALGHPPTETRYLPPEILHLRRLGISTTPLAVNGTEPLFADARQWLSDHGFFPSDQDAPGLLDRATQEATHTQRLDNVRKFEQMSSRLGLRAQLDEMIEGGTVTWLELPTKAGTHRVSLKLIAERYYASDDDPYQGTSHDWTIPKMQTLNYAASTLPGEEQFSRTPFAWNAGVNGSITNPFDDKGSVEVQGFNPDYTYSQASSTDRGSGSGSGHEYYMLSPTENGTQIFTQKVRYRLEMTYSHGPALAPRTASGDVRLDVPTYRTFSEKSDPASHPAPAVVRELEALDTQQLALPTGQRTLENNVLRLPEPALLDQVGGSKELRRTVVDMIDDIELAAARAQQEARDAETPRMPGSFPADPPEIELPQWNTTTAPAGGPPQEAGESAGNTQDTANTSSPENTPGGADTHDTAGAVRNALYGSAKWVADAATGVGRWVWHTAVGEPATNPESMAHEVTHTGLSPHHLNGGALRIFRDSYVLEGAARPGALAGTDITVEVTGYLTDVKVRPQGPKMDAERWQQSVTAGKHAEREERGHRLGAGMTGSYGKSDRGFIPGGAVHYDSSSARSVTMQDNTGAFRVTTEDTAAMHRFSATPHYIVNVKIGTRNFAGGLVLHGPYADRTRVVDVPDGMELLLVDNDLQNHPELLDLVKAAGGDYEVPAANTPDRQLPAPYVESGGLVGYSAVTDVDFHGGRAALQSVARRLVEQIAPGAISTGSTSHVPGVLTRINEHTTSQSLRAIPGSGPDGRIQFHFIDRSWFGPQLVEVTFTARPDPDADLNAIRGRRVTENSGVDNILGHSLGDGSALDPPGATSVENQRRRGHEVSMSFGGQQGGHRPKFDIPVQRTSTLSEGQISTRELRAWQRSFGRTSEFVVPYKYFVEVSSRPLTEAWPTYLLRHVAAGVNLLGYARAGIPAPGYEQLVRPTKTVRESVNADNRIRFNTSETRTPDLAGNDDPRKGDTPAQRTTAGIHRSDPSVSRPAPASGDVAIEMELTKEIRDLLAGPTWVPTRPFTIYDFAGVNELGEALRLVDPSLASGDHTLGNSSTEGMFIRLTRLVASNRLTVLGPAATAPYLNSGPRTAPNPQAGPLIPAPEHTGPTAVKFTLYSSRIERTSKDIAIDRVEPSVDGFRTAADNTLDTSLAFDLSNPYSGNGNSRGGFTLPITGEEAALGQAGSFASQRREFVRFGTPMEKADGTGAVGHRVRALAVLEVRGPEGTLWVTGDLVFRTTETPPQLPTPEQPKVISDTEKPKPLEHTGSTDDKNKQKPAEITDTAQNLAPAGTETFSTEQKPNPGSVPGSPAEQHKSTQNDPAAKDAVDKPFTLHSHGLSTGTGLPTDTVLPGTPATAGPGTPALSAAPAISFTYGGHTPQQAQVEQVPPAPAGSQHSVGTFVHTPLPAPPPIGSTGNSGTDTTESHAARPIRTNGVRRQGPRWTSLPVDTPRGPASESIEAPQGHTWEFMPDDGDCFFYAVERVVFPDDPPATQRVMEERIQGLRAEVVEEIRAHTDQYFEQFTVVLAAAEVDGATDLEPAERNALVAARKNFQLRDQFNAQVEALRNRRVWRIAAGHLVPEATAAVLARRGLGLRLRNEEIRATPGWILGENLTADATVLHYRRHYYLAVPL